MLKVSKDKQKVYVTNYFLYLISVVIRRKAERMTDRQLRHLKRTDLLELLLEQREENERLQKKLGETEKELKQQKLDIANAGSIAEAALRVSHVFEDAQRAADLYLKHVTGGQ